MALACNIDAKGKAVRLRFGLGLLVLGAAATLFWAIPSGAALAWTLSLALLGGGAFSVFEARAGWCAVRALGFKTRV